MPLQSGTKLGACDIIASIGAGGMGEVYEARDTKLATDGSPSKSFPIN